MYGLRRPSTIDGALTRLSQLQAMNTPTRFVLLLPLLCGACMPVASGIAYEALRPVRAATSDMSPLAHIRFESRIKLRVGDSTFVGTFVRLDSLGVVMTGRHEPMRRIRVADIDSVWLSRDNMAYVMAAGGAGAVAGSAAGGRMSGRERRMGPRNSAISMGSLVGAIAAGAAATNIDDWVLLCYRGPAPGAAPGPLAPAQ